MQLQTFIERHNLKVNITPVSSRPDEWDTPANHYHFVVRCGKRSFSGYYSAGLGIKGQPTACDILDSLALDASCADRTFDDFCSEMGYENDSRRAERTFKACKRTWDGLVRLLGNQDTDFLMYNMERL